MLFVLDIIEKDKTFKGRIREILKKDTTEINVIPVFDGKSFCRMGTRKRKGEILWNRVSEQLKENDRLIVPLDISVPEEYSHCLFKGERLWDYMLFNSAINEIKKAKINPAHNRVALIDYEGIYARLVERLLFLAADICVITAKYEKYKAVSEELMKNYGFSLVIKTEPDDSLIDFNYIISPENRFVPLRFKGVAFCKNKKRLLNGKCLVGGGFSLPQQYEELWNKKLNKLQFACALYELCEVKELKNLCFTEMCS